MPGKCALILNKVCAWNYAEISSAEHIYIHKYMYVCVSHLNPGQFSYACKALDLVICTLLYETSFFLSYAFFPNLFFLEVT